MIRFECDYAEGAHPRVLEMLARTNMEQSPGYGDDAHCERARALIRALCASPEAEVCFLSGGTQANLTVIAAALRPHECVVSAASGHINGHEAGAIEATGHKVIAVPCRGGKLTAEDVSSVWRAHRDDPARRHLPKPALVYISNPTELGTVYSLAEMEALRSACDGAGMKLYLDGARLAYGFAARDNDLTLPDIARLTDAFYIGGTKCGALLGEAVVITDPAIKDDFYYIVKQRGGRLAKGRLLGIQFEALLEDGLYFELGARAVRLADTLREACARRGLEMLVDSPTNQLFPILSAGDAEALAADFAFLDWQELPGDMRAVRLVTSWATREEDAAKLARAIEALTGA